MLSWPHLQVAAIATWQTHIPHDHGSDQYSQLHPHHRAGVMRQQRCENACRAQSWSTQQQSSPGPLTRTREYHVQNSREGYFLSHKANYKYRCIAYSRSFQISWVETWTTPKYLVWIFEGDRIFCVSIRIGQNFLRRNSRKYYLV